MGQHRAALRAKARRQKIDYWRKMRPFVVFMAGVLSSARRASILRIGRLFGGYIRERLNQPSFAELIFPVLHPVDPAHLSALGIQPRPGEIVEQATSGGTTTIHRTKGERSYLYASMDADTYDQLRNVPNEDRMRITTVKHAKKKGIACGKCHDKIKPSRDEKQTVTDKRTGKSKKKIVRVLGDSYRWIKFNRGPTLIRCMKPECAFRQSDMTRGKMSGVYAAQESAQDSIAEWEGENVEDLKQILSDAAEAIKEVAQEYTDSADNIEQAFTGGSATADECKEKAESLESWADELEQVDFEEWDGPDEGDEPEELKCKHCEETITKVEGEDDKYTHGEEAEGSQRGGDSDHDAEPEETEAKNSQGQTREEWAEDQRSAAEEAIGNCPV